jgi:hypothetical protein
MQIAQPACGPRKRRSERQAFGEDATGTFRIQTAKATDLYVDAQGLSLPGKIREFADVAAVNTLGKLVALGTAYLSSCGLDEDGSGGSARFDML